MKTNRILVLFVGIFALAAGLQARTFEGRIRQQMTVEGARGASFMNYFIKEGFMRIDMEAGQGKVMSSIFDLTHRQMIFLMPEQKMYMVKAIPEPSAQGGKTGSPAEMPEITRTGEHETICGYKCEKIIVKGKDGTSDMWVADNMGTFMSANSNPMGRGAAHKSWEAALGDKGGWPLRVVTKDSKGVEKMRMETVEIEAKSLPDSTFAVPEGFKKFEMPSIPGLGGLLGGKGN